MKSVLISIRPKWVEKIASGEKTIEVRKSAPKEVPFKAYIYCTKGKDGYEWLYRVDNNGYGKAQSWHGKVIGEFICDRIDEFYCASVPYQKENNLGYGHFVDNGVYKVNGWHEGVVFERNDRHIDSMLKNNDLKEMCLSAQEIFDYIGIGKHLYGWHISDLKIYDKPKELSEFRKSGFMTEEEWLFNLYPNTHCHYDAWAKKFEITRPPQSWCYVEELCKAQN